MQLDHTAAGLEVRLHITGAGRFAGAAFLILWLMFWAAFECLVCWLLAMGALSLLTGQPPGAGQEPLRPDVAAPIGLFLLAWLAFWTFGGIAAGNELLRLLFGCDLIRALSDGLEVEHRRGLFRSRRRVPPNEIRRFYRPPVGTPLCVETTDCSMELTRLGTPGELAELEQKLNAVFGLSEEPSSHGRLPKGWFEILSPEHDSVLVRDPAARRKGAVIVWLLCALVASLALYLLMAALRQPAWWAIALILAAISAGLGWAAVRLSFGRNEWRLEKGRLVLHRRFGMNRMPRFEAVSLELVEDHSGEDGSFFELKGVATALEAHPGRAWQHRRTIFSRSDDPTEPRNLGLWLSERCHLPFADLTTAAAKAEELDHLKHQLASSGRFGRGVLRVIQRLGPSRNPPGS